MLLSALCMFYCILKTGRPGIQMSHCERKVSAKIWFYINDLIIFSCEEEAEGSAQSFTMFQGRGADVLVTVTGIELSTVKWIVTNGKEFCMIETL